MDNKFLEEDNKVKNKQLRDVLINLNNSLTGIQDSAVILSDGLVIASNTTHNIDEEKLGTVSAALFGLANSAAKQFDKDIAQYVLIKCNKSYIAMFRAGEEAELVVDFDAGANIDEVINECLKTSKKITELVYAD